MLAAPEATLIGLQSAGSVALLEHGLATREGGAGVLPVDLLVLQVEVSLGCAGALQKRGVLCFVVLVDGVDQMENRSEGLGLFDNLCIGFGVWVRVVSELCSRGSSELHDLVHRLLSVFVLQHSHSSPSHSVTRTQHVEIMTVQLSDDHRHLLLLLRLCIFLLLCVLVQVGIQQCCLLRRSDIVGVHLLVHLLVQPVEGLLGAHETDVVVVVGLRERH
mmetsp:Transcript_24692/g.48426  ORF Transcript_24692/g.48426 Transcript_24692/m.48426 type:complete len:218 (+) Transcript_24692:1926-2579(+)